MKKVLFVATVTIHINTFHIPYLKMLKEQGYEVHVASNGNEKIEYCDKHFNLPFERFPLKKNNIKVFKELRKIIEENNYEFVHCHTPVGGAITRLAAKKARKKGTRIIYTAHGFHFFKGAPLLNWLIYYPIEKVLAKYTDTLITINQEDYDRAKNHFKIKQIELIHGVGVDKSKFDFKLNEEEKLKIRSEFGFKKDDYVFVSVAELSKRKNQIMQIEAMKELIKYKDKSIKLLIVGKGNLELFLKEKVKEYGLEEIVKFAGFRKDIQYLLKSSDCLLATSYQEGLAVNVMEGMMCNLPIIATNCRGQRDLLDKENIVEINDIDSLVTKMQNFINNNIKMCKYQVEKIELDNIKEQVREVYMDNRNDGFSLIIPSCTDYNRGDQALLLETARIIKETYNSEKIYMMSFGETKQCEDEGLISFEDVLKHPSRFDKRGKNLSYGVLLKLKWGIVASFDFLISLFILNKYLSFFIMPFLKENRKKSINLYKNCNACFVKGGGFMHDYSGGIIGVYTMYYQMYHILLAQRYKKPVYVLPNSYGPFKNNFAGKLVKRVLKNCTLVTARESVSANKETNGLDMDIIKYPDLAFFLETDNNFDAVEYLKSKNIDVENKKYVAITVRPYRFSGEKDSLKKYEKYKLAIKEFIIWLNSKKYSPLLVVHTRAENEHENDESCINEICDMITDKRLYTILKDDLLNCRKLKKIYGYCKYTVGTRFHSVIFSISEGTPSISITYGGNKGDGITHDIDGGKYAIKISDISYEELKKKFEMMEKESDTEIKSIERYIYNANGQREKLINEIKKHM